MEIFYTSLLAAGVSALVNFIFNLVIKNKDYRNSYYSLLLSKRIEVYSAIQEKLSILNNSALCPSPCHIIFLNEKEFNNYSVNIAFLLSKYKLWVSDNLFTKLIELNRFFNTYETEQDLDNSITLESFGRKHYREFAILKDNILEIIAHDMYSLHEIPRFLKTKKRELIKFNKNEKNRLSKLC